MSQRRPANAAQLGFTFDPPTPASTLGELAGLDRRLAGKVALALKEDVRSRHEIAGAMSALLDDNVTKLMLDAYASEARDTHNISAGRWLALVAVTERFDLLDRSVRHIGASVLVGEELRLARLGHLKAQQARINDEVRKLERQVTPIERGSR